MSIQMGAAKEKSTTAFYNWEKKSTIMQIIQQLNILGNLIDFYLNVLFFYLFFSYPV